MRIESLEARRLFTALGQDLSFATDGQYRIDDVNYLGNAGTRFVVLSNYASPAEIDFDYAADYRAVATRFHADGTPDVTVGPTPRFDSGTAGGVVDADDRLVFASPLKQTVSLSRYTPSNKRDRAFAATFTPPGLPAKARVTAERVVNGPDGSTFVLIGAKSAGKGRVDHAYLAKVDSAGVADVSFGIGGLVDLGGVAPGTPTSLAGVDGRGRAYLVRDDTVVRLKFNGSRDRSFATGGALRPNGPKGVVLDSAGRPLVVVTDAGGASLTRYDQAGQADPAFGDGGTMRFAADSAPDVTAFFTQADSFVVLQLGRRIVAFDGTGDVVSDDTGTSDPVIARQGSSRYLIKTGVFLERLAPPSRVQINSEGTVYVRTGDGTDRVTVTPFGQGDADRYPQNLRIAIGDKTFKVRNARTLNVDLRGGDDVYASTARIDLLIDTGDGDDRVDAGGGFNRISTGPGDDTIKGGASSDDIKPGGGSNTIDVGTGGFSTDHITIGEGYLPYGFGYGSDEGTAGLQKITGAGGPNPGQRLQVYLGLGATADIDYTGESAHVVIENNNADRITLRTVEPSRVRAGGGNDTITTGNGRDTIYGDAGDDLINGGPGRDKLVGGDGSDTGVNDANDVLDGIEKHRNRA